MSHGSIVSSVRSPSRTGGVWDKREPECIRHRRVAERGLNRIASAQFILDDKAYRLDWLGHPEG